MEQPVEYHHCGTQLVMVEQVPKQQNDQQFEQAIQRGFPATMRARRFAKHPIQRIGKHGQLIQWKHQTIG